MEKMGRNINVSLSFEKTAMPPFTDILILGQHCPLGMAGVGQCLDLLIPDEFDRFEVDEADVAAVIINKAILKRLDSKIVLDILRAKVFPFMSSTEMIKVDFKARISYDDIAVFSTEGV